MFTGGGNRGFGEFTVGVGMFTGGNRGFGEFTTHFSRDFSGPIPFKFLWPPPFLGRNVTAFC